jgi:predicted metal-dependent phosphoesterase TrpH
VRQKKIFNALIEIANKKGIAIENLNTYNPSNEFAHQAIFRMMMESEGTKKYLDMSIVWPKLKDLYKIINENRGQVFLAHPYHYGNNIKEILEICKPYIDGIEIYNFDTSKEQLEKVCNYARDNDLLLSVGNDYHGKDTHHVLGVNINPKIEKEIIDWIEKSKNKIVV